MAVIVRPKDFFFWIFHLQILGPPVFRSPWIGCFAYRSKGVKTPPKSIFSKPFEHHAQKGGDQANMSDMLRHGI